MTPRRLAAAALAAVLLLAPTASARTYSPQVIGGHDASPGEHPFTVALLDASELDPFDAFFCGGSLISETWVLTAAHCVVDSDPDEVDVMVGTIDLEGGDGTRIAAADIVVHEGYDDESFNDVALIELSEPVPGIAPIALAGPGTTLERAGTQVTLTGWGITEPDGEDASPDLQEATMPVVSDATCDRELFGIDADRVLCAGAPEDDADGGVDSCYGDSGGPLFGTEGGEPVEIGIVSYGVEDVCGIGLTAYTRVSAFADWIAEHAGLDTGAPTVERLAGTNRFATAADLAEARWTGPIDVAYVVTGAAFPDALAAAAAAADVDAPVLLTAPTALPAETTAALGALDPARIVVVGGPGAVSEGVITQLEALASESVTRIAGVSRYDTAALLSREGFDGLPRTVFLASGEQFADALGGAAAAAHRSAPLLLTARDGLPDATRTELGRIGPDTVVVLGGTASVSAAVVDVVEALGITVERLAGADRYATSIAVLESVFGSSSEVVLASGTSFPDGLVAGALGDPVVLVSSSGVATDAVAAIAGAGARRIVILGGTGSVPATAETVLAAGLA